jgi:DNA-binding NarL/FixJ family response regulator
MTPPISITIADAQYLTRLGLRYALASNPRIDIIAEAGDEEELLEELANRAPDLLVLDHNQPGYFSADTIGKVRKLAPATGILIISAISDKNSVYLALEHGINSFLTKTCDQEEILDAVKATVKGEKFFCTKVLDCLLERTFGSIADSDCSPIPLSPREIEIVRLVAKGLIAKEIASLLNLSTHTVYTHRKNIMKKLSLNSSSELVMYAINAGILN